MYTTELLRKLIREETIRILSEASEPKVHLKNLSQYNIFICEVLGRLSDGAWENSKPFDHWEKWKEAEVIIGAPVGYYGFKPSRTEYNLNILFKVTGARMLLYGAAGMAQLNLAPSAAAGKYDTSTKAALESFFIDSGDATATDLVSKLKGTTFESLEKIFLDNVDAQSWMKPFNDIYNKNKESFKKVFSLISSNAYGSGNLKTDTNDIMFAMRTHLDNKEDKSVKESGNTKGLTNLRSTIYEGVRKAKQLKK